MCLSCQPGIKCGLRTCGPADRQRYNLRTKKLRTMTADHGIKWRLQFADQTGVEVLNDRPVLQCFFLPATALYRSAERYIICARPLSV